MKNTTIVLIIVFNIFFNKSVQARATSAIEGLGDSSSGKVEGIPNLHINQSAKIVINPDKTKPDSAVAIPSNAKGITNNQCPSCTTTEGNGNSAPGKTGGIPNSPVVNPISNPVVNQSTKDIDKALKAIRNSVPQDKR